MELKALELARKYLEPGILENMLKENIAEKDKGKLKVDNSLHNYLINQSGNRYIKDFFEHYGKYYEILFMCEDADLPSAAMAVRQHRKIIKALLNRDWRAAKNALSEHIHINHMINTQPQLIVKLAGKNKQT
jgi:DNA-binding FadR family transcriptional regulator